MIAEKLDVLVAEIRDSRGRERKVRTDSRKSQERSGELAQTGGLQLPQSSSVSLHIILNVCLVSGSFWHDIWELKSCESDIWREAILRLLRRSLTQKSHTA